MTAFCRVRATESHVVVEGPRVMVMTPEETTNLIRALTAQLAAVRRVQAEQVVIPPVTVQQLPPYPEQADGQQAHWSMKRELLLGANEAQLMTAWRTARRKHTV